MQQTAMNYPLLQKFEMNETFSSIMQVGVWIKAFIRSSTGRDDFSVDFHEHRNGSKEFLNEIKLESVTRSSFKILTICSIQSDLWNLISRTLMDAFESHRLYQSEKWIEVLSSQYSPVSSDFLSLSLVLSTHFLIDDFLREQESYRS